MHIRDKNMKKSNSQYFLFRYFDHLGHANVYASGALHGSYPAPKWELPGT